MTDARDNVDIWDSIYSSGRMLWYPYEVAVRILHGLNNRRALDGRILDHGCGSGNHLEFMTRLGLTVVGSEVSPASKSLIEARFAGAKLRSPPVTIFNPAKPLVPQLPKYDHAFIWGSIHYNRRPKFIEDLHGLIGHLPAGGKLIIAVPSVNDVVAQVATWEQDGSIRITRDVSEQKNAVLTVARDEAELRDWCPGIKVEDCGRFGWTIKGVPSEFIFLYGEKA